MRRFRENPLVLAPPHIRFYAGAPLIDSNGFRLGSLCVLDHKPREFDAENCNVLCNFAEVVVREIEKDKRRVRRPLDGVHAQCCTLGMPGGGQQGLVHWHVRRLGLPQARSTGHEAPTGSPAAARPQQTYSQGARKLGAPACSPPCAESTGAGPDAPERPAQELEAARVQTEKSNLLRAMDCFTEGVMLLNVVTEEFRIMFMNDSWARITGAPASPATCSLAGPGVLASCASSPARVWAARLPGYAQELHGRAPGAVLAAQLWLSERRAAWRVGCWAAGSLCAPDARLQGVQRADAAPTQAPPARFQAAWLPRGAHCSGPDARACCAQAMPRTSAWTGPCGTCSSLRGTWASPWCGPAAWSDLAGQRMLSASLSRCWRPAVTPGAAREESQSWLSSSPGRAEQAARAQG